MKEKLESILNEVRPSLQADGGDVEFVEFADNLLKVRLTGACKGCPMSQMTLKQGIEKYIQKQFPDVTVESVDA